MEEQKSGTGVTDGTFSGTVCILEWCGSDRRIADFVWICCFFGWQAGLCAHGWCDDFLFVSSDEDFYFRKCHEPSDLSGISGRG